MSGRQPYGVGMARLTAPRSQSVPRLEGRGWHTLVALSGGPEGGTPERLFSSPGSARGRDFLRRSASLIWGLRPIRDRRRASKKRHSQAEPGNEIGRRGGRRAPMWLTFPKGAHTSGVSHFEGGTLGCRRGGAPTRRSARNPRFDCRFGNGIMWAYMDAAIVRAGFVIDASPPSLAA